MRPNSDTMGVVLSLRDMPSSTGSLPQLVARQAQIILIAQLPVGAQMKEGHGGDMAGSQRGESSTVDRGRSRRGSAVIQ